MLLLPKTTDPFELDGRWNGLPDIHGDLDEYNIQPLMVNKNLLFSEFFQ